MIRVDIIEIEISSPLLILHLHNPAIVHGKVKVIYFRYHQYKAKQHKSTNIVNTYISKNQNIERTAGIEPATIRTAIERSTTELYAQYELEMRGVEPRTFRMQSGRATTVPHPHITLSVV